MKAVAALLLLAVVELARARPQFNYGNQGGFNGNQGGFNGQALDKGPPPAQYSFDWNVNDQYSGNLYGHQEERDNDDTKGSYYVQLPDGRRLVVEYFVDQWGYHPTVTYEGEAQFPVAPNGQGGGGGGYYQ